MSFLLPSYQHDMTYNGRVYKSMEHAYHAAKCYLPKDITAVQDSDNPALKAHELCKGNRAKKQFNEVQVILDLIHIKFSDPILKKQFLEYPADRIDLEFSYTSFCEVECNSCTLDKIIVEMLIYVHKEMEEALKNSVA